MHHFSVVHTFYVYMKRLFILLVPILVFACKGKETKEEIIIQYDTLQINDSITSENADSVLTLLESILTDACDRAEKLINHGVSCNAVRDSLRHDSVYVSIARRASHLDSLLLDYMENSKDGILMRMKYEDVIKRNIRRARKAGLN